MDYYCGWSGVHRRVRRKNVLCSRETAAEPAAVAAADLHRKESSSFCSEDKNNLYGADGTSIGGSIQLDLFDPN